MLSNLSEIGYTISSPTDRGYFVEYNLTSSQKRAKIKLFVAKDLDNNPEFWTVFGDKISVLLFHGIGFNQEWRFESREQVTKFIDGLLPQVSPHEKMLLLLEYIRSLSNWDGESVQIDFFSPQQGNIWRQLFFNSPGEFRFYIEALKTKGWIEIIDQLGHYVMLQLTLNGLLEVGNYLQSKSSNFCFVAMSFDSQLIEVYASAIEPAIRESGFIPLIMHQEHVDTSTTINDAIIASIKKAKFTIADFTQHKAGVYFGAGYALGRGQKVIYTCKEGEIDEAHFDTRNYQHIIWKDATDLKRKLIDKIEAFIKD